MSSAAYDRVAALAIDESRGLASQGRWAEARDNLLRVLEPLGTGRQPLSPRREAELWFVFGEIENALGDAPAARDAWQQSIEADPSYKRATLNLVESRMASNLPIREGDLDTLIDYASLGRDAATKRRVHQQLRERLKIKLTENPAKIRDRVSYLERIHRESPSINYPKQYLGRAAYLRRDYRGAIELLASVVDKAAESTSVLNIIGRCHEKLDELGRAATAYERSLVKDPEQPGILFRLGRIRLIQAQI